MFKSQINSKTFFYLTVLKKIVSKPFNIFLNFRLVCGGKIVAAAALASALTSTETTTSSGEPLPAATHAATLSTAHEPSPNQRLLSLGTSSANSEQGSPCSSMSTVSEA